MGAVYQVLDERTERRRALKVMLARLVENDDMRARFTREARIGAQIGSEHIVEVLDAAIDPETDTPFLVMELLEGDEVGRRIAESGRLAPAEVLTLLHQAAFALGKTQAAGVVHRDLKPENLFVIRRDDGSKQLKILDFGIAKIIAESTQQTGILGTPLYMAPEQVTIDQALTPKADLYALGQIAYTLLVGAAYWGEEAKRGLHSVLVNMLKGIPELASLRAARRGVALPAAFDAWFEKAVALRPVDRFADAMTMVTALAGVLGLSLSAPGAPEAAAPHGAPPSSAIALRPVWCDEKALDAEASPDAARTTDACMTQPLPAGNGTRLPFAIALGGAIALVVIAAIRWLSTDELVPPPASSLATASATSAAPAKSLPAAAHQDVPAAPATTAQAASSARSIREGSESVASPTRRPPLRAPTRRGMPEVAP